VRRVVCAFPIAVPIVLSDDKREQLQAWTRRPTSAQALALRARIVLACADTAGQPNSQIAQMLAVSRVTVTKWRNRFAAERLDGLLDEPRPGRPRTITDADVERVITTTLETTPKNATHWSTRSMAADVGLSQTAVHRLPRRGDPDRMSNIVAINNTTGFAPSRTTNYVDLPGIEPRRTIRGRIRTTFSLFTGHL
jgi:transposase